jgi:ubiquinol-cytochrome c reductase iron-sulfur subunit
MNSIAVVNEQRRYFLIGAASVVGGLGFVGAAVPFVESWRPSAKARSLGAPVTVDFSRLKPGEMLGPIPAWRGQPIFVLYRTRAMLDELRTLNASRADPNSDRDQQPEYARNEWRSRRAQIGIYVGICTHLSCSPKYVPVVGPQPFDAQWRGGFWCPCHGSRFDLAGRVAEGVPAPANLVVPPYRFVSETVVTIGVDEQHAAP